MIGLSWHTIGKIEFKTDELPHKGNTTGNNRIIFIGKTLVINIGGAQQHILPLHVRKTFCLYEPFCCLHKRDEPRLRQFFFRSFFFNTTMRVIRQRQPKGFLPNVFILSIVFPRNKTMILDPEVDDRLYLLRMLPRNMRIEQQRFEALKGETLFYTCFQQGKEAAGLLFAEFKAKPKFGRDIPQYTFPRKIRYRFFNSGNTQRNIISRDSACQ